MCVTNDQILVAVGMVFLTKDLMPGGNIFVWLMLCVGVGILSCLYGFEWYARVNCPQVLVNITCSLLSFILYMFISGLVFIVAAKMALFYVQLNGIIVCH